MMQFSLVTIFALHVIMTSLAPAFLGHCRSSQGSFPFPPSIIPLTQEFIKMIVALFGLNSRAPSLVKHSRWTTLLYALPAFLYGVNSLATVNAIIYISSYGACMLIVNISLVIIHTQPYSLNPQSS